MNNLNHTCVRDVRDMYLESTFLFLEPEEDDGEWIEAMPDPLGWQKTNEPFLVVSGLI